MSVINYWPSSEHISQCIRTEAEELADHVLLAVHEPMQLLRVGDGAELQCTEADLLAHFLEVERPIPLIGRSGVGKSHLIRWLESQLKLQSQSANWHIVRIPKNASLRQVLEILLKGLEGEEFESARLRIRSVGEMLKVEEVADLLLTFMSQQLQRLNARVTEQVIYYRDNPLALQQLPSKERERWRDIHAHTTPGCGLSELITDPNFKRSLLNPKHCIYQFASRLTQGATDQELSRNDYQIRAEDLDFSFNLDDLSQSARQYVSRAQLNTNRQAQATAAGVLNEVLGESTRTAFRHLFSFNGGSFLDLFKDIRRTLKHQDRTLVVLVEDMAAISAIEDVLIDSLLEEAVRDEKQELCTLRSAIAVTDGYQGYLRRQDTIRTRAQYEWLIRDHGQSRDQTLERIVDFCGRYLNAARHGSAKLKASWLARSTDISWPLIWEDPEGPPEELQAFGYSPSGVPLFPFNRNAINALADHYCSNDEELKFNPRQVLNQIVLRVLRDHRQACKEHRFPPAEFAGIKGGAGLIDLYRLDEPARCETVAAIWGHGCRSIAELQRDLDWRVANVFGLNELASLLKEVQPVGFVRPPARTDTVPKNIKTAVEPRGLKPDPDQYRLEEVVSEWFQRKRKLEQEESKKLRSALNKMYQQYAHSDWFGLGVRPELLSGSFVYINIPFSITGNRTTNLVSFCQEEDFDDPQKAAALKGVALALLRYENANPKSGGVGWQYDGGFEDYLRYQNFAAYWVPQVLETLAVMERSKLPEIMSRQLSLVPVLGLWRTASNDRQRLNELLTPAENILESLPVAASTVLSELRRSALDEWDGKREAWLKLVAANDHGMDGDLALKTFRDALKVGFGQTLVRYDRQIVQELQPSFNVLSILEVYSRHEQFCLLLDEMIEIVRGLSEGGLHYPDLTSDVPNAKKMVEALSSLRASEVWATVKIFLLFWKESELPKKMQMINQVDGKNLEKAVQTLSAWDKIYANVLPRLENENRQSGLDVLVQSQERVTGLLKEVSGNLAELLEACRE
ncbi:protein DpdH [Halopseudomonas aestusnigri]|uniref:protein DpdH n=1 Tax=Halopseudomonas aestusnigri TaxID=857252 RepID=UPI002555B44D|nr:protein DpdH [Halopseudomonas aestusnigri]MDL2198121.1 protein DpdH [Halopseudomonas aestusnigri]